MRNEDNETEILLGNKQLLGIFFVVAVLLGVAFTGGYMVGHGSSKKSATTAATASTAETAAANSGGSTGGETHSVGAEASGEAPANESGNTAERGSALETNTVGPETSAKPAATGNSGKNSAAAERTRRSQQADNKASEEPAATAASTSIVPHSGQTFLQVVAVGRDEAEAVADVLHKKGFRAHAVPKPGNPKIYRVLIGPMRDTGDLSATRDSLRRAGFRDVIVQRY